MADSTMSDVSKMKVVDLRKELKARGLSYAGDKAELVARLQTAMSQDEHSEINLDSDEIDSDGVLEDEDDKSHNDILDDPVVDTINEELALEEHSPVKAADTKPARTLKRKITTETKSKDVSNEDDKETSKKIVLNRSTSVTIIKSDDNKVEAKNTETEAKESNKIKITADIDPKARLEQRAKRFGLPIKLTDAERKEARKQRFGQGSSTLTTTVTSKNATLSENLEKLKKRAERFGQSVSKIMTDIENKEKLEKRKAKFGTVS